MGTKDELVAWLVKNPAVTIAAPGIKQFKIELPANKASLTAFVDGLPALVDLERDDLDEDQWVFMVDPENPSADYFTYWIEE